ncbi:MAG: hypothetical protein ACRERC_13090, partial [Candidatus Binatia bacterium]
MALVRRQGWGSGGARARAAFVAALALLGLASSASAIVFTGPSYTPPGGATCSVSGDARTATG